MGMEGENGEREVETNGERGEGGRGGGGGRRRER